MSIVRTLLVIAVVGVVCWLLLAVVPMPHPFGLILVAAAVILTLLWVLREAGVGLP